MIICVIPVRMGSQRLNKKNLRNLGGIPLIIRAISKCKKAKCFDEIWVNSEHQVFGDIAKKEEVQFHQRPTELGNHNATSEQYITEFLVRRRCEYVIQVHSIAPLMTVNDIKKFVNYISINDYDSLLSTEEMQIECAYQGKPVNFSYSEKTNSQNLKPVQRISWSITAWKRDVFLDAVNEGKCATYAGKVGYYPISRLAAHVIKTEEDLRYAEALLPFVSDC